MGRIVRTQHIAERKMLYECLHGPTKSVGAAAGSVLIRSFCRRMIELQGRKTYVYGTV